MAVRSHGISSFVKRWLGKSPLCKTAQRIRPDFVQLEDRVNPTPYLFVDFGDNFNPGGLSDTLLNFQTKTAPGNPSVNGPDLASSFGPNAILTMNSYNSIFGAAAAQNRADIMSIIRRYYEPTGVTVVELKATPQIIDGFSFVGAKTLIDASITLGLNEGQTNNNDSYTFVGQGIINGTDDLLSTYGLAGISNGTDFGSKLNQTDGSVLAFVSPNLVLGNVYDADTIAHENGHSFGLRHVYDQSFGTNPISGQNWALLSNSEIMSYNRSNNGVSDAMTEFSRFPTILGDGNLNPDILSTNKGIFGTYDQLQQDPDVGFNPTLNYVTGTGANDIITITKTGANQATVKIAPFSNNSYTSALTIPGTGGTQTVYTYTISLDKTILIDAGPGADRLVIGNDLGVTVRFRGMEGVDSVVVSDAGGAAVTYAPAGTKGTALDTSADFRASLTFGGTTLALQELETTSSITVSNGGTVTYVSPGGVDKVTVTGAAGGKVSITGTVNGNVTAVPFTAINSNKIALNLGNGEVAAANDSVTFAGFSAAVPFPTGGVSYDGGLGTDSLTMTADANFTLSNTSLLVSGIGTIALTSIESATLTGGASANSFIVNSWSGAAVLDGGTGSDKIVFQQDSNITLTPTKLSTSTGTTIQLASIESADLTGGAGDNTFDLSLWTGPSTISGLAGTDAIKLIRDANFTATDSLISVSDGTSYPVTSVELITLTGGAGNNSFDLNGWTGGGTIDGLGGTDSISITRDADFGLNASTLTVSAGLPITITNLENANLTGGASANTFTLVGWNGNATLDGKDGSDTYIVTPSTKSSTIQIADSGSTGTDAVEILGTSGDDTYSIEPDAVTSGLQRVQYANVESVLVDGGAGDDTFVTDINKGFAKGFTLEGGSGQNTFVITGTPSVPIQQSGVLFTSSTAGEIRLDPDGSITPSLTGPLNGDETIIPFKNMSKIGDVTPAARFDFAFGSSSDTITVSDGGVFAGTPTVQVFDGVRGVSVARKTRVVISGGGGTDLFSLDTTAAVPGVTAFDLNGGSGSDNFTLKSANLPVGLYGFGGDDTFSVGTAAKGLDGVTGAVTIDGGTGTNTVSFDDTATAVANTNVTIDSTGITGLTGTGSTAVSFVAGTISNLSVLGASTLANTIAVNALGFPLSLTTGAAADSITLAAIGAPASILTGAGPDTVQVNGISTGLSLLTQDGDDSIIFGAAGGSLDSFTTPFTFDAGNNTDTVTYNDAGDTTGNSYTISPTGFARTGGVSLNYTNVESAKVLGGGTGDNSYLVTGLTAGVSVTDGSGNGTFNIAGDTLGGTNSFSGAGGNDTFTFGGDGIAATTTVDAGTGTDTSSVRGTAGDNAITVTTNALAGSVAGAGAGTLTYAGLESMALDALAGSNSLTYLDGTSSTLAFQFVPTNGTSGKVTGPTGTTGLTFANTNKNFVFNGGTARDSLTVYGVSTTGQGSGTETTSTNGVDVITVSDTAVSITNTALGSMRPVTISSTAGVPTVKNLTVRAGNETGDSADQVTVTPSTQSNILIYGGSPTKTPGDKLVVNTVGPRTVSLDTDANGKPITRVTQISNGATVGFAEFETAPRVELVAVGSGAGVPSRVQVYDAGSGAMKLDFSPFGDFTGGISVATGDVNGDQYPDIIVSAGAGGAPIVKVYDGIFGTELASFLAYSASFTGGVQVASGDINGDGVADIVIGSGPGGGPHVQVVSGTDFTTRLANFFAYDPSFRSGVQVATGDVNGDGRVDIITGAGAGGGPHVRAFSGKDSSIVLANFFAFDPNYRGGVNVTAGDVFGDGKLAILAAPASAGSTTVYAYNAADGSLRGTFNATGGTTGAILPIAREDGVRLATADIDGDGVKDVITARGRGTLPVIRAYKLGTPTGPNATIDLIRETSVFAPTFTGGVYVG